MSEPTEDDRSKAMDLIAENGTGDPDFFGDLNEAIAQALADERGKARAEFLRLADVLDIGSSIYGDSARRVTGSDLAAEMVVDAVKASAETIRQYVARRDAGQEP